MDLFSAIQEYVWKTRSGKADGRDIAAEIGRARHRCNSHSYCCCCAGAARKRDSSTSTHDLSTYVWHTEGDGVEISSSITADDEDDRCSCRTGCSCGRKDCSSCLHFQQSNRCSSEGQKNSMCDASTSSFDLSTYVWGTEGDMCITDSGQGGNSEVDGFVRDLGDADNLGKGWGGVDRKRPRAAATTVGISSKGGEVATTPPRKKKRRIGNQKD